MRHYYQIFPVTSTSLTAARTLNLRTGQERLA
jgi:hypothetical protein